VSAREYNSYNILSLEPRQMAEPGFEARSFPLHDAISCRRHTDPQSFVVGPEGDSLSYPDVALVTADGPQLDPGRSPVPDAGLRVDGQRVHRVAVSLVVELDTRVADIVQRLSREPETLSMYLLSPPLVEEEEDFA